MLDVVESAIEHLCYAFERHGYNPTPIIDLGVLVVAADGKVDAQERSVLLELFQQLLGAKLSAEVVDHLVTAGLEVIEAAGAASRARLIAEILVDCDAVEEGVLVAIAVAYASEGVSAKERLILERIADGAALPRPRLEELIKKLGEGDGPTSVRTVLGTKA